MNALSRRALLGRGASLGMGLSLAALAGCSSGTGANSDDGFATGDGTLTIIAPDKRKKLATLKGTTLEGKELSLDTYAGQVIVLNVWGSWCPPCRHEAPQLVEAATKLKGVAQFVGLNTRDLDQAQAEAFVRTSKMPYPNIYDPDGSLLLALRAVPPKAIPSTLVLDKQGRIAARVLGEVRASTLVGMVTDIADGK